MTWKHFPHCWLSVTGNHMIGAKPLSKPMLGQLSKQQTSMKFNRNTKLFIHEKCIWKHRLRNGSHFVSASICQHLSLDASSYHLQPSVFDSHPYSADWCQDHEKGYGCQRAGAHDAPKIRHGQYGLHNTSPHFVNIKEVIVDFLSIYRHQVDDFPCRSGASWLAGQTQGLWKNITLLTWLSSLNSEIVQVVEILLIATTEGARVAFFPGVLIFQHYVG